jgi:hypothetical protein
MASIIDSIIQAKLEALRKDFRRDQIKWTVLNVLTLVLNACLGWWNFHKGGYWYIAMVAHTVAVLISLYGIWRIWKWKAYW